MAEYIEREALLAYVKDLPTWWADDGGVYGKAMKYPDGMFDCEDIVVSIENAPAADVAPVVRCKDCLLRGKQACAMYYRCGCGEQHTWETDDDFCSWGKRRTDERAAV